MMDEMTMERLMQLRRRLGLDERDRFGRRSYDLEPEQERLIRNYWHIQAPDVRDFTDCRRLRGRT